MGAATVTQGKCSLSGLCEKVRPYEELYSITIGGKDLLFCVGGGCEQLYREQLADRYPSKLRKLRLLFQNRKGRQMNESSHTKAGVRIAQILLTIIGFLIFLALSFPTQAEGGEKFLENMAEFQASALCHFHIFPEWVRCDVYVGDTGALYLAIYHPPNELVVIKRVDGEISENIWVTPKLQPSI